MILDLKTEFQGGDSLEVYQEVDGPTDYVPGPGADMVPNAVGHGGIGTHILSNGDKSRLKDLPVIDRVLFTIGGLSRDGIEAARKYIDSLGDDQSVTRDAVLEALKAA